MANPKAAEVRDLSDDALLQRLAENKEELFNLRFQHVTGQLDNSTRLTDVRRDVARILTELRAREITAAEALAERAPASRTAMGSGGAAPEETQS